MIRLGAYYGYIAVKDNDSLTELTTRCRPANMQRLSGKNISIEERDILRARYLAASIKNLAQKTE